MLRSCLVFKEEDGEKTSIGEKLVEKLPVFVQSADLEVQERVSCSYHVFLPMKNGIKTMIIAFLINKGKPL